MTARRRRARGTQRLAVRIRVEVPSCPGANPYRCADGVARAGCASRCSGRSGSATARGATSPLKARCSAGCWPCWCSTVAGCLRRMRRSRRSGRDDRRGTRPRRCRRTCPGSVAAFRRGSSNRRLRATRIAPARLDVDADRLTDAVHRAVDTDDREALATIDEILERWHGPGVSRTRRRRRRTGRGDRPRRAAGQGGRGPSRTSPRRRSDRRSRRRARRAGRRRAVARAAARAADVGARRDRPARRGVAGVRRLPPLARRGARDRAVAGAERQAGGAARRRRCDAVEAGAPAPARGHVARGPNGDDRGDHRLRRGPAPADADRTRRRRQDPAPHRDRSPPAGGSPGPPRRDVRTGGRERGVRRRRRRRRADDRPPRRRDAGGPTGGGARGHARWCCCSTTASTSSTRSPTWSIVSWSPARTCRSSRPAASGCGCPASSCSRCRRSRRRDDDGPAVQTVRRAGARGGAAVRPRSRRAGEHCRDRPPSRRAATGDRAGGGALAHARRGRGGGRAGPPLRAAVGRGTNVDAPRFVGRGGVVVLRAARCGAAAKLRRPVDLRRALHGRRRCRRSARSMFAGRRSCSINSPNVRSWCGARGRRFALLETLRAFGVERLLVEGRVEEAGARHARHYVEWIDVRAPAAGLGTARSPTSTLPCQSCALRSTG